jgi:hypothetical protein
MIQVPPWDRATIFLQQEESTMKPKKRTNIRANDITICEKFYNVENGREEEKWKMERMK